MFMSKQGTKARTRRENLNLMIVTSPLPVFYNLYLKKSGLLHMRIERSLLVHTYI